MSEKYYFVPFRGGMSTSRLFTEFSKAEGVQFHTASDILFVRVKKLSDCKYYSFFHAATLMDAVEEFLREDERFASIWR